MENRVLSFVLQLCCCQGIIVVIKLVFAFTKSKSPREKFQDDSRAESMAQGADHCRDAAGSQHHSQADEGLRQGRSNS